MYPRFLSARVAEALGDTPVVALTGARQTGKTTLVREIASRTEGARYFSLDDAATMAAVAEDPAVFVHQDCALLVIDEAQRVPGLLPAIKVAVDSNRRPGRFLHS